jgi:hypothetical protein
MTTWHHGKLPVPGGGPVFGVMTSHIVANTQGVEEGSQHVFYGAPDGNIYELAWKGGEAPRTRALAGGGGALASHAVASEDTQHVFHLASTHIWEIWWAGGGAPNHGDLMPDVTDPLLVAQGGPVSHVTPDGTQHVFYTTILGHLMELAWRGGESPRLRDLTLTPQGPALRVETRPSTYVAADGTQHVIYGSGGHVVELTWSGRDGQPQWRDLTVQSGPRTPLALSRPVGHVFDAEGTQHAFYIAEGGHVIELWWQGSGPPHLEDLTDRSGGPLAFTGGGPVSHVFAGDGARRVGTQHVFYRTDDGAIFELWWEGAGPVTPENLLKRSDGAPPAVLGAGDPVSHVVAAERTQHVFYASTDGAITELWSEP